MSTEQVPCHYIVLPIFIILSLFPFFLYSLYAPISITIKVRAVLQTGTMVNFSRRWNGDGFFSPTMEWQWFLKILTITIDGMVPAQPLAAMVFQWFFQF